ncbi:hypothetical protein K438DRAFT_1422905, partial [Mycena galopus ATCC 62051]
FPLSEVDRRQDGTPSMVSNINEFKRNWNIFTEESTALFDWNNVVVAAVLDNSASAEFTCVRTKHTVSIHSQSPHRTIQIVLRLYSSPAEILAGFDIDAACCAYDGDRIYANPRAIVAMMRQCNTIDISRRSPSYEARLAKYSGRRFEVYVPELSRAEIAGAIYQCAAGSVRGLARLLVLEK